jgi:hypothetical protein
MTHKAPPAGCRGRRGLSQGDEDQDESDHQPGSADVKSLTQLLHPDSCKVDGTWSHGDIPVVSPQSAPTMAFSLMTQFPEHRLVWLEPRKARIC